MHKAAIYFLNEWDGIEAISHYGDVDWDNKINFFDYLSYVLNKAADLPHMTPKACRNLLPDKWKKE